MARLGGAKARQGTASRGKAWHGSARCGRVRLDMAGPGEARLATARLGRETDGPATWAGPSGAGATNSYASIAGRRESQRFTGGKETPVRFTTAPSRRVRMRRLTHQRRTEPMLGTQGRSRPGQGSAVKWLQVLTPHPCYRTGVMVGGNTQDADVSIVPGYRSRRIPQVSWSRAFFNALRAARSDATRLTRSNADTRSAVEGLPSDVPLTGDLVSMRHNSAGTARPGEGVTRLKLSDYVGNAHPDLRYLRYLPPRPPGGSLARRSP